MLIKVIREAMIKDMQADGSIEDKKVENVSILQINGCSRSSFDTHERRRTGTDSDGMPIYEVVTLKGLTSIYSGAGVAYDFRISDSEHLTLVAKFDGSNGVIATVKVKLDGSVTMS
ncbi:hypothetical protein JDFnp4_106 [Fusobacterium phage JD-Fnp4]|nr:hypothetical protein JDFnp4_106 [Fusobacterium phage JD-Fnp4]